MQYLETPVPPSRKLTHLAFLLRLTKEERTSVRTSIDVDVQDVMFLFEKATFLDFDDPVTQGGLYVLMTKGIFDADRMAAIMEPPVTEAEGLDLVSQGNPNA